MAVILVDSCIITDLAVSEGDWFEWSVKTLEELDLNHTLSLNPIIYAECSVGYESIEEVDALFEHLGFGMKPIPRAALFLAGKAFYSTESVRDKKAMCCRISS